MRSTQAVAAPLGHGGRARIVRIGKREDAAHAQGAATAAAASARKDRRAAAAAVAAARDGDVSSDDGSPFPHQRHRLRTLRNAKINQQPATREPSKSPVGERSKAGGGSSRNGGETADLWGAVAGILMPASPRSLRRLVTCVSASVCPGRPPPAPQGDQRRRLARLPDKPRHQPSPQQDRSPSKRELTPSSKPPHRSASPLRRSRQSSRRRSWSSRHEAELSHRSGSSHPQGIYRRPSGCWRRLRVSSLSWLPARRLMPTRPEERRPVATVRPP